MEFISNNWQDIRKYYENTYVKFVEFGDRLFFINSVTSESIQGIDDDGVDFILYMDNLHPYTVNYILPHKASFQWKDTVYMLQRVPARQYKRGLCSDNTMITNIASGSSIELSFAILKAFVQKPVYSSFGEAFTTKAKVKAIALTSRMSYLRIGSIIMDARVIAHFNHDTRKITMKVKAFLPEIMKHMRDHNEHFEVTL